MKLNFKVSTTALLNLTLVLICIQDLKQQKFTVDAEPSDTVCLRINA
jgi:hypothetical protein